MSSYFEKSIRAIKRLFIVLLIFAISGGIFSPNPQKAEAFFTTTQEIPSSPLLISAVSSAKDALLQTTKDLTLDKIGWGMAKIVLKGITRSTVAWINGGFQGNPAFITNPNAFFSDVIDQEIGKFIEGSDLQALCSPFQLEIKQALVLNRSSFQTKSQCRLSQVIGNFDDFISGIERQTGSAGGWAG